MNICLFDKTEIECSSPFLSYDDKRGEHILNILHKVQGDSFTAGIIDGASGLARITRLDEKERRIYFEFTATGDGKPLNPLNMIVGFVRPIQLRRLLRDVAALGVNELHLTGTELGEKSYMQSDLAQPEKVRELLLEGTVQAGSTHVPKVFIHKNLQECLEDVSKKMALREPQGPQLNPQGPLSQAGSLRLSKGPHKEQLICLDNINPECSLGAALAQDAAVPEALEGPQITVAIGSERGWTDRERDLMQKAGFIRCGMGERIMRTETAVTVAGAIILNSMGRLSGQARQ